MVKLIFDNYPYYKIVQLILEDTTSETDESLLDHIIRKVEKGEEVLILYDTTTNKTGNLIMGLDFLFKLDGLTKIMNEYFAKKKIQLKASSSIRNNINFIKIEKFLRIDAISKSDMKDDIGRDVIDERYKEYFR